MISQEVRTSITKEHYSFDILQGGPDPIIFVIFKGRQDLGSPPGSTHANNASNHKEQ